MATFAIVRQDGEVDKVDAVSVEDAANRYGWPGNGTITPWDEGSHGAKLRHALTSPEHQGELINDKPKKAKFTEGDK